MDPKSLSLPKNLPPPEGNSAERSSPPTLSDSLSDMASSTLDNAEHIHQHPELRTSSRSNKGHYSESNPQSYGRYMLLFAFLGAAISATEPFEPKSIRQAKADIMWKK